MSTVKQSVNELIHDTNGSLGLLKNYLHSIQTGRYTMDLKYIESMEEAIQRTLDSIDKYYTEMRGSKLWEEHL